MKMSVFFGKAFAIIISSVELMTRVKERAETLHLYQIFNGINELNMNIN